MLDRQTIECCSIQFLWKLRSTLLVRELGLLSRPDVNFALPLARYVLGSCMTLPVKTVVLVERPYRSSIHPYVSSAMSYDLRNNPSATPSTAAIATDMRNKLGTDWAEVEAWFRDSWMFIKSGVFLINVCCFEEFMANSLNERVAVERFVRDMIVTSYNMSGVLVELVALGNPAISSSNRIRSSIADRKTKLKVHRGINPAGVKHKFGDLSSPNITIGSIELTRSLHRAIARSRNIPTCTIQDYDEMATTKQANVKSKLVAAHRDFDEDMERVAQFFKSGGKYEGPVSDEQVFTSLRKTTSRLVEVLIEERVIVMLAGLKENDNTAKGAYSSGHREYQPRAYKLGSSSEVSAASRNKPTPVAQKAKWLDEDDVTDTGVTDTPSKSSVPTVSSSSDTKTEQAVSPQTPTTKRVHTPVRSARSVSGLSVVSNSRSATKLKFIDEDSDGERENVNPVVDKSEPDVVSEIDKLGKQTDGAQAVHRPTSPVTMSEDEGADMNVIGEFLHSSSTQYGVSPSVVEEVNEAASHGRASSTVSKQVLEAVRQIRASSDSSIEEDLGFVTGNVKLDSPIMKLLLKWAS